MATNGEEQKKTENHKNILAPKEENPVESSVSQIDSKCDRK